MNTDILSCTDRSIEPAPAAGLAKDHELDNGQSVRSLFSGSRTESGKCIRDVGDKQVGVGDIVHMSDSSRECENDAPAALD